MNPAAVPDQGWSWLFSRSPEFVVLFLFVLAFSLLAWRKLLPYYKEQQKEWKSERERFDTILKEEREKREGILYETIKDHQVTIKDHQENQKQRDKKFLESFDHITAKLNDMHQDIKEIRRDR